MPHDAAPDRLKPSKAPNLPVVATRLGRTRECYVSHREAVLKGNSSDLEIVWTDPLALSFKRASDLGAFRGAGIIEREGGKRRQKHVELCVFAWRIGARFGAMTQFVDHNRT